MALLWLAASVVLSEEPMPPSGYVLLRDGAVLRGTVEEEPGRVVIRHQGSEIRLTRDRVACWSDSLEGLYQYQLDRRRIFTLETYVDAARWCLRHGLHERAAAELTAATRLDSDHLEVERTKRDLQIAIARAKAGDSLPADGTPPASPPGTVGGNPLPNIAPEEIAPERAPRLERIEANLVREFTAQIQPLLTNRCNGAACHGSGSSTAFRLEGETIGSSRPSASDTRRNLEAALRWVDPEHPLASPLLVRALEPHGQSDAPPLGAREQAAVDNLRRWISSLSTRSGEFAQREAQQSQLAAQDHVQRPPSSVSADKAGLPVRLPGVEDPFDPELFNRRFRTQ